MPLKIETFSALKGGNSFFKAITHPAVAAMAEKLVSRLAGARSIAVYDPLGFLEGFAGCWTLSHCRFSRIYVQAFKDIGTTRLGLTAEPVCDLASGVFDMLFVVAFDADRLLAQIKHLIPASASIMTLDQMRLPNDVLTNHRDYLDPLNFATNFAFFRDKGGWHTRIVTANYWSGYGAAKPMLCFTLFDRHGNVIGRWTDPAGREGNAIIIDSKRIRTRFHLPEFEGQLFIHVIGIAGHDVIKYALDTYDEGGSSLSCTHDANAWPADYYAGLPAPAPGEKVVLWIQNSMPFPIPEGAIGLNLMGADAPVPLKLEILPYASVALDVSTLLPDAKWPQQIEIAAGKHIVRPRYEITRGQATRIAHPNVERTDLVPEPEIAQLGDVFGKGFILPAPILPRDRWRSIVLPTPMARSQAYLPIAAVAYDSDGKEVGYKRFGRLARSASVALDLDEIIAGSPGFDFGHVELMYDFDAGEAADGWLHALFRYESRNNDHVAETSFGSHMFNTMMTWRNEPQSYSAHPPGLSTRLFLRLGEEPLDTLCHLIYPASTTWHPKSATDLVLLGPAGGELARRRVEIPCGGSLFWRAMSAFSPSELAAADGGYIAIRDATCRLFGYHGLLSDRGRFSLDHMFGF
jgi:hypothetical protein